MLPCRLFFIASLAIYDAWQLGWEGVASTRLFLHIHRRKSPFMSIFKDVGQVSSINHNTGGGKSLQWAVMVTYRTLPSCCDLGESLDSASRRAEEGNFLTCMAGHCNPSCRTGRKNLDRKLFCSFKPC